MKWKLLIGLGLAGALAWVAVAVPLGERTLWDHGRRVFSTPEATEAARDIKEGSTVLAGKVVERAGDVARTAYAKVHAAPDGTAGPDARDEPGSASVDRAGVSGAPDPAAAPMDDPLPVDRARLRKLLE